jgi:hypothetical protein
MSAKDRKQKWNKKTYINMKRLYVKFYIGDKAWLILHNKIQQCEIEGIRELARVGKREYLIGTIWYEEDKIHQTKQSLWKNLIDAFEKEKENGK